MEDIFKEPKLKDIPNEPSKAEIELDELEIVISKYKPYTLFGITVPSMARTDSDEEAKVCTKSRTLEDLTKDEIDWLHANINFIVDTNGDFIPIGSGNQYAFYQTLVSIHIYIYVHNIPIEFFDLKNPNSRYYKLFNIGELIDSNDFQSYIEPEFKICVDVNMNTECDSKAHANLRYDRFTYGLFKDVRHIEFYKKALRGSKATAVINGSLQFDNIDKLYDWFNDDVLTCTDNICNNITKIISEPNALYLNSKHKTTDTFTFLANPKAWIKQADYNITNFKSKVNIIIYPVFTNAISLLSYVSNAKNIEVAMESMSNKIKTIIDEFSFKDDGRYY